MQQAALSLSNYLWTCGGEPAALPESDGSLDEEAAAEVPPEQASEVESSALTRRPEILALEFNREAAKVDSFLARNSLLPQLDALWSEGEDRGAGGIGRVRRIGVELSLPLFFRSARGLSRQARLSIEGLDWSERALKLRVANEVRDAVSSVNADARRLAAARREAELARRLERAERAAFDLGDSTLFLVNQRERASAEALGRVVDVLADYRISRATLTAARAGPSCLREPSRVPSRRSLSSRPAPSARPPDAHRRSPLASSPADSSAKRRA